MATSTHAHAVAAPLTRERPRSRRRQARRARARGGILWIAISGILLAGVVFVNVAVLRLNISLDSANTQRAKLRAENQALQSQLASELASGKIQARARSEFGLRPADVTRYLDLGR